MIATVLSLVLAASVPEVALLCTAPDGDFTELRFQRVGSAEVASAVARFTHVEGSTVLGVVLPKSRVVLATATAVKTRDESFASALVRLEAGKDARVLADRVAVSTRPVLVGGRVFVQRGRAGEETPDGRLDELTIDEVDAVTGKARTVYSARGGMAFLAGALGSELVVYRVDSRGAQLEAVHIDTLGVRTLHASLGELARDFDIDAPRRRIIFTQGRRETRRWEVRALDVGSGEVKTLASGPTMALLPVVFPDGRVAFAPGQGEGLRDVASAPGQGEGLRDVAGRPVLAAQGSGFERVRAFAQGYVIGLDEVPSDFPAPFAVSLADGQRALLVAPDRVRLDIAGLAP